MEPPQPLRRSWLCVHPSFAVTSHACLWQTRPPKPGWVMNTSHLQGKGHAQRALTSGVWGPWGSSSARYPSPRHAVQAQSGPRQTHPYLIGRLPPHRTLQVKRSKPPVPQESSQRLCKTHTQTQPARAFREATPRPPQRGRVFCAEHWSDDIAASAYGRRDGPAAAALL